MNTAKLFTNGKSQAVCLPKDVAWKLFDKSLDKFSKDFMFKRNQPKKLDKRVKL